MLRKRNPDKTRQTILDAALSEIHRKGFQAASLTEILADTGLTRGALYHHFPNKQALGLAALDTIEQWTVETWVEPLEGSDDPVTAIQQAMLMAARDNSVDELLLGCPLNNLAQELANTDDVFRQRITEIYDVWRGGMARAFERGKAAGNVAGHVDPMAAAAFFVASITGARGLAKTARDISLLEICAGHLANYLETLRT